MRLLIVIVVVLACLPQVVFGLPAVIAVNDADGDATVTLYLLDSGITDDTQNWCEVRLVVLGADNPLTEGDTCTVQVWEDDGLVGDDCRR